VNSNSTAGLAELVADSNLKTITNRVWYLCFGETKLAKSTPHRLVPGKMKLLGWETHLAKS